MTNLRIISVDVVDSTTILAKFTEKLDPSIGVSNVTIQSELVGVPSPLVIDTSVTQDELTLTIQPLTPQVAYTITFKSAVGQPFRSLNGEALLFNDGITNKYLIIGPIESDNPVQQFLENYLKDNIYNVTDKSTVVSKIVQSLSTIISKALYDIRQVKNENYLSYTVVDEEKFRGSGPFDRLNEESTYLISRVGRTPTGTNATMVVPYTTFPSFPVSLQANPFIETLTVNSDDVKGTFDINTFILNLSNQDVSKVTEIKFFYTDARPTYEYDIKTLGYQILDSKYDQDFAFSYATLKDNQVKISESILNDSNFSTQNIFNIEVDYEFRNLGRVIDPATVIVTTVLASIRETLPPIINVFNLKHAPITDSSGVAVKTGAITFIDPNAGTINALHPAFKYELPFNYSALPYAPGQYSVDYASGTIYVYGADQNNDGTGPYPPLATYKYLYTYKSDIDYTYDTDLRAIVALPYGNLIDNPGTISFNYEQVLIPGIDYNASTHVEVLSERINNKLLALNVIRTENTPITNVFRIFNETSGEIYNLQRWSGNKIYFSYNNPPSVKQMLGERASFSNELNEILFVNQELVNASSIKIFKCLLSNNKIISSTEDSLSSSINTSTTFSNTNVFTSEKWWDGSGLQTITQNINHLTSVGQYQVDYTNGIVYVAVSTGQGLDIGTISYKTDQISPQFPHVLSVDDIYYRISILNPKNKNFTYNDFSDGSIIPATFDNSDELSLNGNVDSVYQVKDTQVGAFVDVTFVPGVTNNVKFVRGLFEHNDLQNNTHPLNFAEAAISSGANITVGSIDRQEFNTVLFDTSYYVDINLDMPYLSPNVTFDISVIRNSDGYELWGPSGTIVPGNPVRFTLPGTNSPQAGDSVVVTYSISINDLSRVIVDYNKGDYYVDYSYLADEIIVSYEYGDNLLDFRQNTSLSPNDTYYVTYKVGALRDALLKNFGTLINVPELATFDVDLDRERYRDAVTGALESFIIGPTITAMKTLVQAITHVEPEIIESVFQTWSLGSSLLNPRGFETTGEFALSPAKYGNGVTVDKPGQTITFPASSNLKLEQGSFQAWIMPEWNGIDNDAPFIVSVTKNGVPFPQGSVFVGSAEYHPDYNRNKSFELNKNDNVSGTPNMNKDGVFIYYDLDASGLFKKWYCEVVDGYGDGYYIDGNPRNYVIKINTPGNFYNVKSIVDPLPMTLLIQSGTNAITAKITTTNGVRQGIMFISDREHYLLDLGRSLGQDRLSIYKDPSGYMNFRVYDNQRKSYVVSADVSSWQAYELHHVAASWIINSKNSRDELHFFIDGFEVPNISRYGNKVGPYLHERFRTINPEEIVGAIDKSIVGSIDLQTVLGSPSVFSSINFSAYGITAGDTIYIDEVGFNLSGYTILVENGNTLTLSSNMPTTLNDGRFSVNRTTIPVETEIDIYPNIAVSTLSSIYSAADMVTTFGSATVSSASSNFTALDIIPGYLIRIDDGYFEKHYVILSVSGNNLVLNDDMPVSSSSLNFYLYKNEPIEIPGVRALRPAYSISQDGYYNNYLVISNDATANDLVLINTLGLNHKRVIQKFYQWGDTSNVIQTRMAPPINLDAVSIYHILFPNTVINGSNSTITLGVLTSNTFTVEQPSSSDSGRTLEVKISSTNNVTYPVTVTITGTSNAAPTTEILTFTDVGSKNTVNKFSAASGVVVSGTPINVNKTFITLMIKEAYSITYPENSALFPVVRYSYQTRAGTTLSSTGGSAVTDLNGFFSSLDVNNYLVVINPGGAAGTYKILSVSNDHLSAVIDGTVPSFTGGHYQLLNSTTYRNGLQNGFFILEEAASPGTPYLLNKGSYEFDFYTYLSIKFNPLNVDAFIGSDLNGKAQFGGTIDEVKITSNMLTDTRIGETIPNNQESITKDFNSLKELSANVNTLLLSHFNSFPFTNLAPFYITSENKEIIQSGVSVNDNFDQSLYITTKPLVIENDGILDGKTEGTIEFWVNPLYDTANDPNYRFYFDAAGVQIEKVTSLNDVTVQTVGRIGKILSVTLQAGDSKIDYFAGGKVEVSSDGAVAESRTSTNSNAVSVTSKILQVVTVKIVGDSTNTDYFANGTISSDKSTIYLGKTLPENTLDLVVTYKPITGTAQTLNSQVIRLNKKLPNQNMPVIVTYIPSGLQGDRISVFKDPSGYINFNVTASGIDYVVRAPAYWSRGTWHRVKASYTVNGGKGTDTIRLFVDGYERGNVLFGSGISFGDPFVFGSSYAGGGSNIQTNIKFKDFLGELYIGSDFTGKNGAFALLDNLRVSNISRPIFKPFAESLDVNYNSNLDVVFPVTTDLYTTLLLDFETLLMKNQDFVTLTNKKSGIFDFSINIFDSFGIVNSSAKVQEVLETLINILKPANSRVFLKYIR